MRRPLGEFVLVRRPLGEFVLRPCSFDWVKTLRDECVPRDITFCFLETGTVFLKDGRRYMIKGKRVQ